MTNQNGTKSKGRTDDRWQGIADVAHLTGKSKRTVRRWCKQGKVDAKKESGQWLIDLQSLDDSRTGSQGVFSKPEIGHLTDTVKELAKENAILEEQLNRALPSGADPEKVEKMDRTIRRLSKIPFVRLMIPGDLRE